MKAVLLFFTTSLFVLQLQAQEISISGTITDENNYPLPGVNVIIKNTSSGAQTDYDGKYVIKAFIGQTLVFSYLGYITIERKIMEKLSTIDLTMMPDAEALNEVVIMGYGRGRSKKALGYAVSTVRSESISKRSRRNKKSIVRSLNGMISGIQITGASGAGNMMIIRGKNSLYGYSSPVSENESYARIQENIFKRVETAPLSTFSIDVDKAGYSNIRRMINNGQKVPQDAVKIEEMINYFTYNYDNPIGDHPFSISTEVAYSPWNEQAKLVKIGLKGKDITTANVPASNLVFLIDVSGSMRSENKLGLLKSAFGVLVEQLREKDKVSIVVYAGAAGMVLPPTYGNEKKTILRAINNLNAGGSTAGGDGIRLAYKMAEENFIRGGNNRVILATDGDFNVGTSSDRAMEDLIVEKRKSGVFLTVLGFGMGNYKDSKMETLADKGNGNHAYIDTMQEARKVLGTEFFGTIYTIAKDVKIQVEFNPAKVQAYRLIGYENRLLNDEDFNDDTKDAGELGSGHTVTALYEVILVGVKSKFIKDIDNLKYTKPTVTQSTDELLTIKFRYKKPNETMSKLIVKTVKDNETMFKNTSEDFKFLAAVALFGMQLRKSVFINTLKKSDVIALAEAGKGVDTEGYRAEFIRLVKSYGPEF